jgi:hypothetical protein
MGRPHLGSGPKHGVFEWLAGISSSIPIIDL